MDKEQDLLEELRIRAAALVEAKEKADDKEDEGEMDDEEDEIEDGAEENGKSDDKEDKEKVDELSKATLGSYVKKAAADANVHAFSAGHAVGKNRFGNHANDLARNRLRGVNKAVTKLTKESEEVNMDIAQIFEGEELSEEFKVKVTALFEAAVAQKVSALEESYAAAMEEFKAEVSQKTLAESAEAKEGLVERVDGYLDYMVEQWIANNEIALERGIKADLFESFMSGMKGLFEQHMINVPEEKIEVLEEQAAEIEELESKVDAVIAENVELKQILKGIAKQKQIDEAADGLSDVEAERFVELAEELSYDNEETFGQKLQVIREQFFAKTDESKQLVESVAASIVTDEPLTEEVEMPKAKVDDVDPTIAALAARLTRQSI
jgi:hypothetical protein